MPEEILKIKEEELVLSLQKYKEAKASYRRVKLIVISNRLLAPYRQFQANMAIVKYDLLIKKAEMERERQVKRSIALQELEEKEIRKQRKEDFKEAVREQRKEDINNFIDDKVTKIENAALSLQIKGTVAVNRAASYVTSVKNSAILIMKKKTTLNYDIEKAILDYKIKKEEALQKKQEKEDGTINFDNSETVSLNDEPKISKVSSDNNYMGKATNRVVNYFKSTKNKIVYKASSKKNKLVTVFNSKINSLKERAINTMGNVLVAADDKINDIKTNIDVKKSEVAQAMEDRRVREKRKEDMISALNEQSQKEIAIKRAQLESMREARKAIDSTGNIFDSDVATLGVQRSK